MHRSKSLAIAAFFMLGPLVLLGCDQDETAAPQVIVQGGESGDCGFLLPTGAEFLSLHRYGSGDLYLPDHVPVGTSRVVIARIDYSLSFPTTASVSFREDDGNPGASPGQYINFWRLPTRSFSPTAGTVFLTFPIDESSDGSTAGGFTARYDPSPLTVDGHAAWITFDASGSDDWVTLYGYTQ